MKNDKVLCKKVFNGLNPAQLSQAKAGGRNIPDKVIHQFIDYFGMDKKAFFEYNPITNSKKVQDLKKEVAYLKEIIVLLKEKQKKK